MKGNTMKQVRIEYKMKDVFNKSFKSLKHTKPFLTNDMKEAIELCEYGIEKNFAVFINDKRYVPMSEFGRTINLEVA